MITAALVLQAVAALGFGYRLVAGPSLTDRMVGLDGMLVVGVSALALQAMATGRNAPSPVAMACNASALTPTTSMPSRPTMRSVSDGPATSR